MSILHLSPYFSVRIWMLVLVPHLARCVYIHGVTEGWCVWCVCRHEKVQENCIDLVGRIADRGAEYVSAREWMRICFELLELLKAHKKAIRRATVNTFGYIAKAIGSVTRAHTHPFNGPFSGTTQVSRYQKGKSNLDFTEARDSEWQWHQLDHMLVCTSLQTDNHASNPPLSFLQAGCPSCRPTNSVKALKGVIGSVSWRLLRFCLLRGFTVLLACL